jgi:hypothetical protein
MRHRLLALTAALVALAPHASAQARPDTAATPADSASADSAGRAKRPKRAPIPVTPALEASAFSSDAARRLLLLAREARVRQDSSITAYDATSYNRISVGLGVRSIGRERLAFRTETAARVRWQRGSGAVMDILGSRAVVPIATGTTSRVEADIPTAPYYPGREALWFGAGVAKADVDPDEVIHPLARGSEAYYRYAVGDSLQLALGNGRTITLRELRVSARRPEWRLIVGSFWFDAAGGQLVRAAYRFSVDMDIKQVAEEDDKDAFEDVPLWAKPMIFPMKATLEGVTIDYGLFNGVWLPRTQAMTGNAQVSFMRVPMRYEERYKYASVNVIDASLPKINLPPDNSSSGDGINVNVSIGGDADDPNDLGPDLPKITADSARRLLASIPSVDSLRAAAKAAREAGDTAQARKLRRQASVARRDSSRASDQLSCAETGMKVRASLVYNGTLPMLSRVPCDRQALINSKELPGSIFEPGEELFGATERDALLKELNFDLQADLAPKPIVVEFSFADGSLRYNRAEGFSAGVGARQDLGLGYSVRADARIGVGDRQPLGGLEATRTTGRQSWTARVYRRTETATDFGQPLAFGAATGALLYAHDDGMYYRAWGADLEWRADPAGETMVRGFVQRQTRAAVTTRWSAFGGSNDVRFGPELSTDVGTWAGVDAGVRRSWGLNPAGWRAFGAAKLEGAAGTSAYARTLVDLTVTRGLGTWSSLAVTGAAGTTAGQVPAQRAFYLGGLQTVRGQFVGTAPGYAGTAFWFARSELGAGGAVFRPSVFYDIGWAGARERFAASGQTLLRGAGVGVSMLDGLLRLDVARGIAPTRQWRADFSVDVRF